MHKTVEVDVDLDEEQSAYFKQTVRSQAELDMITAENQMKKDLQI